MVLLAHGLGILRSMSATSVSLSPYEKEALELQPVLATEQQVCISSTRYALKASLAHCLGSLKQSIPVISDFKLPTRQMPDVES